MDRKPVTHEYRLGQFIDYRNLYIKCLNPYQMYCEVLDGDHNSPISFEDWRKADKENTWFGIYKSQDNAIYINNCITNEDRFIQVLRHELTHAFLSYVMPVNTQYDEEVLCETISKHYDEYTKFINGITQHCLGNYRKEMKHCD